MRGEYCVAWASIMSGIAVIMLVFAHISQINPTSLPAALYMVEVNTAAYGAAFVSATNTSAGGMYDTSTTDKLGTAKGLRQYYRWGLYGSCGYQKGGGGVCNATSFGHAFTPMQAILGDTPSKFYKQTSDIVPSQDVSPYSAFKNTTYTAGISVAAFWCVFVGSILALFAFIAGVIPSRLTFFAASVCSIASTLLLLVGCAMWTALIKKVAALNIVKVKGGVLLGFYTYTGPGFYLIWVAFACVLISVFPYVLSWRTFEPKSNLRRTDSLQLTLLDQKKYQY